MSEVCFEVGISHFGIQNKMKSFISDFNLYLELRNLFYLHYLSTKLNVIGINTTYLNSVISLEFIPRQSVSAPNQFSSTTPESNVKVEKSSLSEAKKFVVVVYIARRSEQFSFQKFFPFLNLVPCR